MVTKEAGAVLMIHPYIIDAQSRIVGSSSKPI